MGLNIYEIIKRMISDNINSRRFTDITYGEVVSIKPLQIRLLDGGPLLGENCLILTDGVIRKEIRIKPHQHFFENDHFKHNHGSTLKYPKSVTVEGSITNVPVLSSPAGPVTGTITSTWKQTKGEVTFDEGKKDLDLSDSGDEIYTKLNRKSTESTLEVMINGQLIPLSKDPDNQKEEDDKESTTYWGLLNEGLHIGDSVVLLEVKQGFNYIVLSKLYNTYYYREDKE